MNNNNYSQADYIRAIVAFLKFKGLEKVSFADTPFDGANSIPVCRKEKNIFLEISLDGNSEDRVKYSALRRNEEDICGCSENAEVVYGFLDGSEKDEKEDLGYLFGYIHNYFRGELDPEADSWMWYVTSGAKYAWADVVWKATGQRKCFLFKLSPEVPPKDDGKVFFNCKDLNEFLALQKEDNGRDFYVDSYVFYNDFEDEQWGGEEEFPFGGMERPCLFCNNSDDDSWTGLLVKALELAKAEGLLPLNVPAVEEDGCEFDRLDYDDKLERFVLRDSANGPLQEAAIDVESLPERDLILILSAVLSKKAELLDRKASVRICPFCGSSETRRAKNEDRWYCSDCECLFDDDDIQREDLRHQLAHILIDTDEDNQMDCSVRVGEEEAQGLSSLELPEVVKIYQIPGDGTIWVKIAGLVNDDDGYVNIDELSVLDLKAILADLRLSKIKGN